PGPGPGSHGGAREPRRLGPEPRPEVELRSGPKPKWIVDPVRRGHGLPRGRQPGAGGDVADAGAGPGRGQRDLAGRHAGRAVGIGLGGREEDDLVTSQLDRDGRPQGFAVLREVVEGLVHRFDDASKMKLPHWNRQRGGTRRSLASVASLFGARKWATFAVLTRTSLSSAEVSKTNSTDRFDVPLATYCFPEPPAGCPPPRLLFARDTLSVSGLKSRLRETPPDAGVASADVPNALISMSWALAIIARSPRDLERQRGIRELELLDRDLPVLGIERRPLELDREAIGQLEAGDELALPVPQGDGTLGPEAARGPGGCKPEPGPQVEVGGHPALQRQVAVGHGADEVDLRGVVSALLDLLRLHRHLEPVALGERTGDERVRQPQARGIG